MSLQTFDALLDQRKKQEIQEEIRIAGNVPAEMGEKFLDVLDAMGVTRDEALTTICGEIVAKRWVEARKILDDREKEREARKAQRSKNVGKK